MPRNRQIPAYQHHKATGQARVRIDGKDHYLGKYGTPESYDRYDDLVAESLVGRERSPCTTISAVLAAWWPECKRRYQAGKGRYGGAGNWRPTIRLLREHCGNEHPSALGPATLRNLIEGEAKRRNWSLQHAKETLAKVKLILKWAKNEELVRGQVYQRIRDVKIRNGRKSTPLPPVEDALVDRTLPHLRPIVADMVRVQRLTAMRPGELVIMQPDDIDRSADIWEYVPSKHKTEHHGKDRTICIGPKAQAILAPWLLRADDYVFPARNGHYTSDSYRRAIQRRCERHGLPKWSPNQLRKRAATEIRSKFDVEHAAAFLGHSSATVTGNHYAANDRQRALAAARILG